MLGINSIKAFIYFISASYFVVMLVIGFKLRDMKERLINKNYELQSRVDTLLSDNVYIDGIKTSFNEVTAMRTSNNIISKIENKGIILERLSFSKCDTSLSVLKTNDWNNFLLPIEPLKNTKHHIEWLERPYLHYDNLRIEVDKTLIPEYNLYFSKLLLHDFELVYCYIPYHDNKTFKLACYLADALNKNNKINAEIVQVTKPKYEDYNLDKSLVLELKYNGKKVPNYDNKKSSSSIEKQKLPLGFHFPKSNLNSLQSLTYELGHFYQLPGHNNFWKLKFDEICGLGRNVEVVKCDFSEDLKSLDTKLGLVKGEIKKVIIPYANSELELNAKKIQKRLKNVNTFDVEIKAVNQFDWESLTIDDPDNILFYFAIVQLKADNK